MKTNNKIIKNKEDEKIWKMMKIQFLLTKILNN